MVIKFTCSQSSTCARNHKDIGSVNQILWNFLFIDGKRGNCVDVPMLGSCGSISNSIGTSKTITSSRKRKWRNMHEKGPQTPPLHSGTLWK